MKIRATNLLIYFVISSSLVGATTVAQEKRQEKRDDDMVPGKFTCGAVTLRLKASISAIFLISSAHCPLLR